MTTSEQRNKAREAIRELARSCARVMPELPSLTDDPTMPLTYHTISIEGPGSFLEAMSDLEKARSLIRRIVESLEPKPVLFYQVCGSDWEYHMPSLVELKAFLEATK